MKFPLFFLGFLTGILATYLFLTQLWWPDVRLEAAHARMPQVAGPTPSPVEFATPQPTPGSPSELIAMSPPLPAASVPPELLPSPEIPAPPAPATPPIETKTADLPILQTDLERLRTRGLIIPVQGVERGSLRDTFSDDRGGHRHEAIDIMAARGTPVLAAVDGRVEKLFVSKAGGLTIYQFDPQGEYCYYYAHLDSYAPGIEPGKVVRRGDVIAYVGSTGNASPKAPHLHFSIFRLGADKKWWEGTAVNVHPLWSAAAEP
jgi:murein DD-endopeptidase MepM/ murein hydrolase activator NlpD